MKLRINIVALTHNDVQQQCVEYAQTAKGKRFRLVKDDANEYDPYAVRVYELQTHVGYVAAQDVEDVRAAMLAQVGGKKSFRALCTGWGCKLHGKDGLYLTAEIDFEIEGDDGSEVVMGAMNLPPSLQRAYEEVFADDDVLYDAWQYSGPIICIDRLSRIDDCTDMLEDTLCELLEAPQDEDLQQEARQLLADFMRNHRFDYSREMSQARRRIVWLLERLEGEAFEQVHHALLADMGFIMSSSWRDVSAHAFFVDTPISVLAQQTGIYDYSDRLDEIEEQLRAFPHDLYKKFLTDPVDFLRGVFYNRVPRKKMLQLLSGLILMVMNHRVGGVERWGKHNDEISLEEMKELKLIRQDTEKVKRETAERCCRLIAMLPAKAGYGWLIKSQADWYAVKRVLEEKELIKPMDNAQFERYINEVFPDGGKKVGELTKEESQLLPAGLDTAYRPNVPLCKKKDLDQAENDVFGKVEPSKWRKLSDEQLQGIQNAKYQRYLVIVDALMGMIEMGA